MLTIRNVGRHYRTGTGDGGPLQDNQQWISFLCSFLIDTCTKAWRRQSRNHPKIRCACFNFQHQGWCPVNDISVLRSFPWQNHPWKILWGLECIWGPDDFCKFKGNLNKTIIEFWCNILENTYSSRWVVQWIHVSSWMTSSFPFCPWGFLSAALSSLLHLPNTLYSNEKNCTHFQS